jgi:hypothetical protein
LKFIYNTYGIVRVRLVLPERLPAVAVTATLFVPTGVATTAMFELLTPQPKDDIDVKMNSSDIARNRLRNKARRTKRLVCDSPKVPSDINANNAPLPPPLNGCGRGPADLAAVACTSVLIVKIDVKDPPLAPGIKELGANEHVV